MTNTDESDFYVKHNSIRIYKCDKERDGKRMEKAFRLYCSQSKTSYELQIRGPIGLGTFGSKEGKDDIIANASLSLEDLKRLKWMVTESIRQAEGE